MTQVFEDCEYMTLGDNVNESLKEHFVLLAGLKCKLRKNIFCMA